MSHKLGGMVRNSPQQRPGLDSEGVTSVELAGSKLARYLRASLANRRPRTRTTGLNSPPPRPPVNPTSHCISPNSRTFQWLRHYERPELPEPPPELDSSG